MRREVRHAGRMVRHLVAYALATGRWWFPLALVVLALGAVVGFVVQTTVTPVVYVLL